jgi:DNA-binding transcriptional regulator YiaG
MTFMIPNAARRITKTEVHLLHAEIEGMIAFADYIEQPIVEIKDDNAFALIVRQAVEKFHVDVEMLADRFGVNRTTIGRWKSGKNAPQPMARPLVISWIGERIREQVRLLQQQLDS